MIPQPSCRRGFTLLELVIVIAIVAILAVLAVPITSNFRQRAQRVQCTVNLKNLGVGASLYLQQNNDIWPQIHPPVVGDASENYANAWIAALEPFSVPRKTWICPTIQSGLDNPDYSTPDVARIDYFATTFDDKPGTAHEWPKQPWFIETGSVHGNGNLILFTDGSINDLNTVAQNAGSGK
ncbi:MAG TPA: prepilin-type N-terminal cleavage/methylation domain-containing protein [Chthoniobacterales bacterium]|nr:prepilin-type N-terminal cleavage/methylation domain-containing protein [Chthoniobacterales bacterium]